MVVIEIRVTCDVCHHFVVMNERPEDAADVLNKMGWCLCETEEGQFDVCAECVKNHRESKPPINPVAPQEPPPTADGAGTGIDPATLDAWAHRATFALQKSMATMDGPAIARLLNDADKIPSLDLSLAALLGLTVAVHTSADLKARLGVQPG